MYRKLRESIDLTVQDALMHHTNMVRGVVTVLQELLQKYQAPIETPVTVSKPHKHVENVVQITKQ